MCTQSIQDGGLHVSISNISGNNSRLMYMDSQHLDYKNTANWTTAGPFASAVPLSLACSLLFSTLICLTISSLLYSSSTDLPLCHPLDPLPPPRPIQH